MIRHDGGEKERSWRENEEERESKRAGDEKGWIWIGKAADGGVGEDL